MDLIKTKHGARQVQDHVPSRYKGVSATCQDGQMSGYLKLRSTSRSGAWKQSWWVLKNHVMYRFKAPNDVKAVSTVPVLGWTLETLSDVS